MASDRASPTDTVTGTAAPSSDTESSETLISMTMSMKQVDEVSGDKEPVVKLPLRPSTAPPAIQTPTTVPSEPLLNNTTPSQVMAASLGPNSDAKAEAEGVKKRGNEILLDETIALTDLRPVYPLSRRALQESVYPNTNPHLISKPS